MKTINTKRPTKLDLDAPLLSARRSNLAAMARLQISRSNSLNNDSTYSVPFLWEQSPGKPKDDATRENIVEINGLPLPKPPPIRWQREEKEEEEDDIGIDLFSLLGSLNTASEREDDVDDDNESDVDDDDDEKNYGRLSPSFMIERFLPAAAALAAASSLSDSKVRTMYRGSKISSISKEGAEYSSSSKGCGLQVLFPWRVKHRVCGVKSPVREPRPRVKSDRV